MRPAGVTFGVVGGVLAAPTRPGIGGSLFVSPGGHFSCRLTLFIRIEEQKPLFDQRLQKILKLMPTKELSKFLGLMPLELIKTKILFLLSRGDLVKLIDRVDNQDLKLLIGMRIIQLL